MKERRAKVLRIPRELLFNLIPGLLPRNEIENRLCFDGLPADAEVLEVHENWERGSMDFLVAHPSFELVQEGECYPVLQTKVQPVRARTDWLVFLARKGAGWKCVGVRDRYKHYDTALKFDLFLPIPEPSAYPEFASDKIQPTEKESHEQR